MQMMVRVEIVVVAAIIRIFSPDVNEMEASVHIYLYIHIRSKLLLTSSTLNECWPFILSG